jgi:drug/metabolite transporter (DMT)-like permease
VVHELGPVSLTFLRYAIALATLLPFLAGAPAAWRRLSLREASATALLGLTQFGLLIVLLNVGLQHVDAGLGALLFATFPLMTLALATWGGHERFDAALTAGVLLTVAGVGIALGVRPPEARGAAFALGVLCVLGSALSGAVCAVLYRPLLQRHAMLPLGALAMAAAVVVLAPAAWAEGLATRAPTLTVAQWIVVAAVGLSSGIAYWLWLWALKHTTPTQATSFLALSPLTAAAIGALALGEAPGLGLLLGLACIAAGLRVVSMRSVASLPHRTE